MYLRELNFKEQPLPDIVVWPNRHEQVVTLVEAAKSHNVALIPFGGGTSVSWGVAMPKNERRLLVVLDTSQMVSSKIFVNFTNRTKNRNWVVPETHAGLKDLNSSK